MSLDNVPIPEINVQTAEIRMERIKATYANAESMQETIDKLAYLAASMEQQRDQAREEAKRATEARLASYKEGLREGLRRFAWWKDGCQYVGTGNTKLSDALKGVDNAN